MAETPDFKHLVPGFDFLQTLTKNASAAMPAIGQWITPTLDADELERRIGELRTVQFWLEQNASMLAATVQALEVQRLTLSTLKTMNVQMEDLRSTLRVPGMAAADSGGPAPAADAAARADAGEGGAADAPAAEPATSRPGAAPSMIDPMQWWGALTQQFSQLAAAAMKEAPEAARGLAAGLVEPARTAANDTLRPKGASAKAAARTGKAAGKPTGAAQAPAKKPGSTPRKRPAR